MRGVPGEERTGALAVEARAGEAGGRAQRAQPEARHVNRVAGRARPGERSLRRARRMHRRAVRSSRRQASPSSPRPAAVSASERSSSTAVPSSSGCASGARRLDPLDAVLGERHRAHERRRDPERVDRRARVVPEAGERQLLGAKPAADRVAPLEHEHRAAGAREHDRRRQAIGPGTDDDRIVHAADVTERRHRWSSCPA